MDGSSNSVLVSACGTIPQDTVTHKEGVLASEMISSYMFHLGSLYLHCTSPLYLAESHRPHAAMQEDVCRLLDMTGFKS
jgi:hypothetical protein